jgi:hypothetical protein
MPEELRVDTAAAQTMADGWRTLVGELIATTAPAEFGFSGQASAVAVSAAHAATAVFREGLAAQVESRAAGVVDACAEFLGNESFSAHEITGVLDV